MMHERNEKKAHAENRACVECVCLYTIHPLFIISFTHAHFILKLSRLNFFVFYSLSSHININIFYSFDYYVFLLLPFNFFSPLYFDCVHM